MGCFMFAHLCSLTIIWFKILYSFSKVYALVNKVVFFVLMFCFNLFNADLGYIIEVNPPNKLRKTFENDIVTPIEFETLSPW